MKYLNYVGKDIRTRGDYGEWIESGKMPETQKEADWIACPLGSISVFDATFGQVIENPTADWVEIDYRKLRRQIEDCLRKGNRDNITKVAEMLDLI